MAEIDTVQVTCSKCRKRAKIAAPAEGHESPVVWKCPAPLENGIDLCGHINTLDLG